MLIPTEVQKQPQIDAAIGTLMKEFAPAVRYILYEIKQDWSGDWAVFFKVLLSDDAVQRGLSEITKKIIARTDDQIYLSDVGLFPYFHFRSESEQAKLKDPAWELSLN